MASRRMFHIDKIQTDDFLALPPSAQCLFFHCMLTADDDGFLARPLALVRMVGCSREDLDSLIRQGFLILFPSGVVLVRHWRVHNCIRHDRYHASILPERELIGWDKTGTYFLRQERDGLTTYGDPVTPAAQEAAGPEKVVEEEVEELSPAPLPEAAPEKQPEMAGSPLGSQWGPEVRSGKAKPVYAKQGQSTTLCSVDPSPLWCASGASTDSGENDVRPDDRTVTPGALQVLQQAFPHMRYTVLPDQKEA